MALTKNDLTAIGGLLDKKLDEQRVSIIEEVKDLVDFRVEKAEIQFNKKFAEIDQRFNENDRNIKLLRAHATEYFLTH